MEGKKDQLKKDFLTVALNYKWQLVEPKQQFLFDEEAFDILNEKDIKSFFRILLRKPDMDFFTFSNNDYHVIAEKREL